MKDFTHITEIILSHFPDVQAVYLFGTCGTEDERPDSDVDIGILLPHETAKHTGSLTMSDCRFAIEEFLNKTVDLINLRLVSTVFQNEIIASGQKILCLDETAIDEFEMMTLSFYQRLNEERWEILKEIRESGKVLDL